MKIGKQEYYTAEEACIVGEVKRSRLCQLIRQGRVDSLKFGNSFMVSLKGIDQLLNRQDMRRVPKKDRKMTLKEIELINRGGKQ